MNASEIDALWKDTSNWRWREFYVCKDDPRLIVPKRNPAKGWTLNFGRRSAIPFLLLVIVLLSAPALIAAPFGSMALLLSVPVTLFELAILVGILIHFSSSNRSSKKRQG
jgi:hypothetical protein